MQDRYRLLRRGRVFYAYDRQTKTCLSLDSSPQGKIPPGAARVYFCNEL
jgi:hypothetical protein